MKKSEFLEKVKDEVFKRLNDVPPEVIEREFKEVVGGLGNAVEVARKEKDVSGLAELIAENIRNVLTVSLQKAKEAQPVEEPTISYNPSSNVKKVIKQSYDEEAKSVLEKVVAQLPPKAKVRVFLMRFRGILYTRSL